MFTIWGENLEQQKKLGAQRRSRELLYWGGARVITRGQATDRDERECLSPSPQPKHGC
jgi:hypothetical protein